MGVKMRKVYKNMGVKMKKVYKKQGVKLILLTFDTGCHLTYTFAKVKYFRNEIVNKKRIQVLNIIGLL